MKSNPISQLPEGAMLAVLVIFGIVIIGFVLIYIFYLKNLQDLLRNIKPENRKMAPGKVWLLMVTFVNILFAVPTALNINLSETLAMGLTIMGYLVSAFVLIWTFYMVNKIAESLAAELASRNVQEQGKPTYALGMFMCLCNTLSLVGGVRGLEWVSMMAAGAGLVAWIMYWVKTNEYKHKLVRDFNQHFDF